MKVRCEVKDLQQAVTAASKGISRAATLPVLSGIRLTANGKLEVSATDLETTIHVFVDSASDEEGSVIVPGKAFAEMLRKLPKKEQIAISGDEHEVNVSVGRLSQRVKALVRDDYPAMYLDKLDEESRAEVVIDSENFRQAWERTAFAVSGDESRQILCAAYIEVDKDKGMTMVGTDSYKLAVTPASCLDIAGTDFAASVPGKALAKVYALAKGNPIVRCVFFENYVVFITGNKIVSIRYIDGQYPKFRQLLPQGYGNSFTFEASDMLDAIEIVGPMAQNNLPVKLCLTHDETVLEAHTPDVGEASSPVAGEYKGEALVTAFNPDFFAQSVKAVGGTVVMEAADGLKPALFRPDDITDTYRVLIMPVRLS